MPERPEPEPRGDPIHIPLSPDEAIADLLRVPPPPEKKRRGGPAAFFERLGFGLTVDQGDGFYWASLTKAGVIVAPRYGRGATPADAAESARERYLVEEG